MFEMNRRNNRQMNGCNPFREMVDLERGFFADPFGSFFGSTELAAFKMDVTDEGDHYLLEADMPGFDKKDIRLDLNGDILTIEAQRHSKAEDQDKKGRVVRMERSYGSFSRQFNVSEIDTAKIKASYKDGVLTLKLPKLQPAEPVSRVLEIE